MLTKSKIKFIKSLQEKKYRKQEQCFVVEGAKSVNEALASGFETVLLVASEDYLQQTHGAYTGEIIPATAQELAMIGNFKTNDAALAVLKMKKNEIINIPTDRYTLILDNIADPGNMGTIIRTADWYGVDTIIASEGTVDVYSPKVISATKGSFTRVNVHYTYLPDVLKSCTNMVYGALLEGKNVHKVSFEKRGVLIVGSESKGISDEVKKFITCPITIPRYGKAESLNAALATAIILDNIKR